MNWEAIGSIGEIVGAAGVIASLFYVAYQVKQNTTQSKLNTDTLMNTNAEAVSRLSNDARYRLAENAELTHIYLAGIKEPDSLSEEEITRFRCFLQAVLHNSQLIFDSSQRGINEHHWPPTRRIVARLISTPGGRWLWDKYRYDFSEAFQKEVNEILDGIGISDNET